MNIRAIYVQSLCFLIYLALGILYVAFVTNGNMDFVSASYENNGLRKPNLTTSLFIEVYV